MELRYNQYQHTNSFPVPRYHHASFLVSSHNAPLLDTSVGQSAYMPQYSSWNTDTQGLGGDFTDSPTSTPYSEDSTFDNTFFLGHTSSPTVGYPESSQRTHMPEYSGIYQTRFDGTLPPTSCQNVQVSSAGDGGAHIYHSQRALATAHQSGLVTTGSYFPQRTTTNAHLDARRASLSSFSAGSDISTHSGVYPTATSIDSLPQRNGNSTQSLGSANPASPLSIRSTRRQSSSYYNQSVLGEPGSPSVVPPLIFDGEGGEEIDDGSECSLPSASSDLSPSTGSTYGSFDDSMSFESMVAHGPAFDSCSPASPEHELSSPTLSASEGPKSKKSKMHQCTICSKWFPRPSGLATHMNSHSGARPFKCPIPSCTKSFAVRSNAKRHLRTHGIFPQSDHPHPPAQFTVGFDTPIISDVPQVGKLPAKLRWVPQSLATRTNVDYLREPTSDSEDEYPLSCPILPLPLPPVSRSPQEWKDDDRYEERNSYEHVGSSPYLSSQWRMLPGPAIVSPPSL
ncbi:hypothetical protein C8Q75DRAFT_604658 [Abortiporus biennis]|nr:hypothetical protein C8Q75DRAFT_604658 [Abortiporus biennis]